MSKPMNPSLGICIFTSWNMAWYQWIIRMCVYLNISCVIIHQIWYKEWFFNVCYIWKYTVDWWNHSCSNVQQNSIDTSLMMTSWNGNIFRVAGHLCGEFTGLKGQWRGALIFSLICVWINGWVNNREAGDLRRFRAHYEVSVMSNGPALLVWISLGGFNIFAYPKRYTLRYKRKYISSWVNRSDTNTREVIVLSIAV